MILSHLCIPIVTLCNSLACNFLYLLYLSPRLAFLIVPWSQIYYIFEYKFLFIIILNKLIIHIFLSMIILRVTTIMPSIFI